MNDWSLVQWGITTIVGILCIFIGRYWKQREYSANKDKKILEKFDELLPYSVIEFIHHHDFGDSFENNIFIYFDKTIYENSRPDFFFLDKKLEKLRKEFIEKLNVFRHLLALNSGPTNIAEFSRIPVIYDYASEKEEEIIKKVESLADELFEIYSNLKKAAHQKL